MWLTLLLVSFLACISTIGLVHVGVVLVGLWEVVVAIENLKLVL